jgi:hypothetical protein
MVVLKGDKYVLLLFLITHATETLAEKRLLLHSEADIATDFIRLRSELANVTQQLGTALAEIKSLKSTQSSTNCKLIISVVNFMTNENMKNKQIP